MFEMPHYEVRYHNKAEWEDIQNWSFGEFTENICPGISVYSGHDSG